MNFTPMRISKRGVLALLLLAFLLEGPVAVRAAGDTSASSLGASDAGSDGETQATGTVDTPSPQPDLQQKPNSGSIDPATTQVQQNGLSAATSIGRVGADFTKGSNESIVVPRSGGVMPFLFENKEDNWMTVSLGMEESYDSNVFLQANKKDDFITKSSPALAFRFTNPLLSWNFGSLLDYRYYARNTRTEDYNYALNTDGRINLLREYAYIIVSDKFTQTSQSTAVDYSYLSPTVNVTNLNTLRVNPRLEIPISSRIRINPQYAYTNYWYPGKSIENRQNQQVSGDISYEMSGRITPFAGYNFNRTEGQLLKYNQHYPYVGFKYEDEKLLLRGSVGYSRVDIDTGSTSDGLVWDASLQYRLALVSFSLASSSDIDQSNFLSSSNQTRKSPQTVTNYSASISREMGKAALTLSFFFRENDDTVTSELLTRTFGTAVYFRHVLSGRLNGSFDSRIERGDQSTSNGFSPSTSVAQHWLIYQIGYTLSYNFGKDWILSGYYRYLNSNNPDSSGTNNYVANRVSLSLRKSF